MLRNVFLAGLVLSIMVTALLPVSAQFSGCHGRVYLTVPALEVQASPLGVRVLYLWAGQGFDIWEKAEIAPGVWWYRIAFANTASDPAIYWIDSVAVEIETPGGCNWSVLNGH